MNFLKREINIKNTNNKTWTGSHPYAIIYKVKFLGFTVKERHLGEFMSFDVAKKYALNLV